MEDFNQPCDERIELLRQLKALMGTVSPAFWAACQVCDLGCLKAIVKKELPDARGLDVQSRQMIQHWGSSPRNRSQPTTPTTTPQRSSTSGLGSSPSSMPPPPKRQRLLDSPTALPRDINTKKRAEERDDFRCVLTGVKITDIAHIYPHHSLKHQETDKNAPRQAFWAMLTVFWSKETVAAWEAKLFPQGISEKGQEEVYNLISLAPTVHRMWGKALFALKPIFEAGNKKTLQVRFVWQKHQDHNFAKIDLTTEPPSTEGLEENSGVWLHDKNGKRIRSGDIFELRTDDPITKPLPSFELLEMQWNLHRIQSMAGAADVEYLDFLDSDSDISDMELPGLLEEDMSSPSPPLSSPRHLAQNDNINRHHSTLTKHQEVEGDGARIVGGGCY